MIFDADSRLSFLAITLFFVTCLKELHVRHNLRMLKSLTEIFQVRRFLFIRVNALHPLPSLSLYGLLLFLWCFTIIFSKPLFSSV